MSQSSPKPSKPAWGSGAKPPSSLYKALQATEQPNPGPSSSKPSASGGGGGGGRGRASTSSGSGGRGGGGRRQGGGGRHNQNNRDNNNRDSIGGRGRGGRGGRNNNNQRQGSHRNNNNNPQQQQQQQQSTPGTPQAPRRKSYNPQTPNKQQHKQNNNNQNNNNNTNGVERTPWEDIVLLNHTGSGATETQKAVNRHSISAFLNCRMDYLDPPSTLEVYSKRKSAKLQTQPQETTEAAEGGPADGTADGSSAEFLWTPHPRCQYTHNDTERLERWKADMQVLWDFKPLEINEATRWKKAEDKEGEALRRAVGILNKLSWTTFEKLTLEFLKVLGLSSNNNASIVVDKHLISEALSLIVQKAMEEPHFAELYAQFSAKLTSVHKVFKKSLLTLCQAQFDGGEANIDSGSDGDANAKTDADATTEGQLKDPEAAYKAAIAKKKYIGLMQFIGELYKLGVIKAMVMISCIEQLFVQADEEKLECFAKLMTTIGEKLDGEKGASDHQNLEHIWEDVYSMAGRPYLGDGGELGNNKKDQKEGPKAPSNRIKFLLQDLIDLRNSGWVESQRKQDSKAKTIAQIHKQVAMEEKQQQQQQQRRPSKSKLTRSQSAGTSLPKSGSFGNLSQAGSNDSASNNNVPQPDADGFTPVTTPKKIRQTSLRRVQSDAATNNNSSGGGGGGGGGGSSLQRALQNNNNKSPKQQQPKQSSTKNVATAPPLPPLSSATEPPARVVSAPTFLSPPECKKKMENLLKEYFVGGDTADAVLSVDELVGVSVDDTSNTEAVVDRGAAVLDAGVMLVLERKEEDVAKMLTVVKECLSAEPPKIPHESVAPGLKEALEFLRDIEIDAPLAPKHLALIVSEFVSMNVLKLDFLLEAPEFFKSDGRPAEFAKQVLACLMTHKGVSDEHVKVVTELMTQKEQSSISDVRKWITEA